MKEYIIIGSLMILTILVSGCITGDSSITGGAAADNSEYINEFPVKAMAAVFNYENINII